MPIPTTPLPITFDDVSVHAPGSRLLDGISLSLTAGEATAVIGPNGSGKTTLLRTAMGLVAPTAGHISWAAQAAAPISRMALVSQRPVMLRRSCAGNVRYALARAGLPWRQRQQRTTELLALVGLKQVAARPARRLSGGEQQRLALARALAREPQALFLDEPTSSLDPAATRDVEDLVRTIIARGVKVVLATHDLGEARRLAGKIVLLNAGSVVESGPCEDFFTAPRTAAGARFLNGELLV